VIGNTTLLYALINFAFRFTIWVLSVFVYLRYVMAIILKYSGSRWASIVTHSLYDGISNVLFHI
jgi:hypothetical protein